MLLDSARSEGFLALNPERDVLEPVKQTA